MINFKTENGSRLITEYYVFTILQYYNIRVDEFNFLREKFGVSAYSQDRLINKIHFFSYSRPWF